MSFVSMEQSEIDELLLYASLADDETAEMLYNVFTLHECKSELEESLIIELEMTMKWHLAWYKLNTKIIKTEETYTRENTTLEFL